MRHFSRFGSRSTAVTLLFPENLEKLLRNSPVLSPGRPISPSARPAQLAEEAVVLHGGFSHQPSSPVQFDL